MQADKNDCINYIGRALSDYENGLINDEALMRACHYQSREWLELEVINIDSKLSHTFQKTRELQEDRERIIQILKLGDEK